MGRIGREGEESKGFLLRKGICRKYLPFLEEIEEVCREYMKEKRMQGKICDMTNYFDKKIPRASLVGSGGKGGAGKV